MKISLIPVMVGRVQNAYCCFCFDSVSYYNCIRFMWMDRMIFMLVFPKFVRRLSDCCCCCSAAFFFPFAHNVWLIYKRNKWRGGNRPERYQLYIIPMASNHIFATKSTKNTIEHKSYKRLSSPREWYHLRFCSSTVYQSSIIFSFLFVFLR